MLAGGNYCLTDVKVSVAEDKSLAGYNNVKALLLNPTLKAFKMVDFVFCIF
jgi:hypothetical protein